MLFIGVGAACEAENRRLPQCPPLSTDRAPSKVKRRQLNGYDPAFGVVIAVTADAADCPWPAAHIGGSSSPAAAVPGIGVRRGVGEHRRWRAAA